MRKKGIVLALVFIIASAGIGTSFSIAVGALRTFGPIGYNFDVRFIDVTYSDNEGSLDIAIVTAWIYTNNITKVTITNAYPGYIAYVDFIMGNIGNGPILLDDLTVLPYNTDALDIQVDGVTVGTYLQPRESIEGQLIIEVLDGASMDSNYPFDIDFIFIGSPQ
jgi:hypothetical protein